jgi:uncharacterized protein (TIGR00725 family)
MKFKVGVMGSASDTLTDGLDASLRGKAEALGYAIAFASTKASARSGERREAGSGLNEAATSLVLLTGATTGIPYLVGRAARERGVFHIGVSPASDQREHTEVYSLPTDACDVLIYTGFGLKGRNVVLVRSCDIVLFISGSIGSLNELTIAHDEDRIIGCLTGTGGVAGEAKQILGLFSKKRTRRVFHDDDPERLLSLCLSELYSAPEPVRNT